MTRKTKGKESLKIFHQALDGEVIELKGRGHYTLGDMGTEEFPELLEAIVNKLYSPYFFAETPETRA